LAFLAPLLDLELSLLLVMMLRIPNTPVIGFLIQLPLVRFDRLFKKLELSLVSILYFQLLSLWWHELVQLPILEWLVGLRGKNYYWAIAS